MTGPPERIGRYQVRSVLGVGGFGTVVSALDEALEAHVAIKVLAPEHAQDPATRERFVREAQLLRRVRSPHLIAVHDVGELDDGRPYIVMELATGGALADRIGQGRPTDAPGVRATITALASGLGALHAAGIVHRDVTPGNLLVIDDSPDSEDRSTTVRRLGLLDPDERIVVADLGLAKDQQRMAAGATVVGGTPRFRAPEQTRPGDEVSLATDVFGATGVLWNLLTGEAPGTEATVEAQLATAPPAWRPVLRRGLDADPDQRHPTMAAWEAAALEAVEADTGGRVPGFRAVPAGTTCPYKGLTSYEPQDASFYFGREALVDEVVARLLASRTLVIGGPSGSGKSSLLRAGLIPAITSGALPGSQHWPVLLFSPGDGALEELAHQLGRLAPDRRAPTSDELRADPAAARRWLRAGDPALLAIDQFEEVFTHESDPAEHATLFAVLDALTASQDTPLRLVLALRSDFYSTGATYPWLADLISANQVLVGPMRRPELRRAIELPAQRAGLRLEHGLVDAFLDEAGDQRGGLPLMAHALMETWMRRRGTVLTLDGFQAAGGVGGAIAQTAEQAYARLDDRQRAAARRVFLRLVTPGEDAPDTRRRLAWDEARTDSATSSVIDRLATDRLLTVDDRGIELVHETLIWSWPRLRDWIEESRDDLRVQQRITRAAEEWLTEARDPDLLYRGPRLTGALEWQERTDVKLAEAPATYLAASRAARDAKETAAAASQGRRRRVRRVAFGAVSLLAVAAIVASVVAFGALRLSQENEAEAEERFARGLATQAESLASTSPKLALALAAESDARVDPIPTEAQQAMVEGRLALAASAIVPRAEPIPVGDVQSVVMSPDGSLMVTGARDGTVQLWDTESAEARDTLSGPGEGLEELTISPDGRWLAAAGADGLWRWDLASDASEGELVERPSGELWSVAFSADGERLVTASEDGEVAIYSTASWTSMGDPLTAPVDFLSVAFTLDGRQVLAGTGDGRVFIWDVASRALQGDPIAAHGTNDVWELVVDPSGERVATASSDGTVRVWALDTGALLTSPFADADRRPALAEVSGLMWSVDGSSLYASGADGRVHEWLFRSGSEIERSGIGHDDRVVDASGSADRTVLATLGRDQDVRLWEVGDPEPTVTTLADLDVALYGLAQDAGTGRIAVGDDDGDIHVLSPGGGGRELVGHTSRVFGLAFLADGRLVSGDDEGTLRLWDVSSRRVVATGGSGSAAAITSIAAAPDGDRVATSGEDGVVRTWDPADLGQPIVETPSPGVAATKVVVTASGDLVASYHDGYLRFWAADGTEDRPPLRVDSDGDAVFSVAVDPDEHLVAAATATDGVTLWDMDAAEPRNGLNGQPVDPVDVAFTGDGAALVSTTRRGTVSLWSAESGTALGTRFTLHSDAVWRVVVAPDATVVAASEDGTVSALDVLDPRRACALGSGSLDARAQQRYLGDRSPIGCPG